MKKLVLSALALSVLSGCMSTSNDARLNELTQRITELETNQRLLASSVNQAGLVTMPSTVAFGDGFAMGDPAAPIAMVEFTDLQCPYCAKFQTTTFPEFKEKYIDTGMVYFVARELPLTQIHPQAQTAAVALRCSVEQDKSVYGDVKNELFTIGSKLTSNSYTEVAQKFGLDSEQLTQCMSKTEHQRAVNSSHKYAASIGLSGTPAFAIGDNTGIEIKNYKVMKGALSIEDLDEAVKYFTK